MPLDGLFSYGRTRKVPETTKEAQRKAARRVAQRKRQQKLWGRNLGYVDPEQKTLAEIEDAIGLKRDADDPIL